MSSAPSANDKDNFTISKKWIKFIIIFVGVGIAAGVGISFAIISPQGADVLQWGVADEDDYQAMMERVSERAGELRIGTHYRSQLETGEEGFFRGAAKGGDAPYSYEWDFRDGTTSNMQNATHAFSSPGTYFVTLKVTDSSGETEDADSRVTVVEKPSPQ